MKKTVTTFWAVILIPLTLLSAWFIPVQFAFPAVMILLVIFCMLLGWLICNRPFGILISEENVMSLARFQTVLWMIIIVAAFVVIAIARIKNGVSADEDSAVSADPLNITLGKNLLALLGLSATSLVGSPLIAATKRSKNPDQSAVASTAEQMIRLGNIPDSVKASPAMSSATLTSTIQSSSEGILYKNPAITDASFTDIFEGNEVGNAAHIELTKVQMFFFTVIVAVAYVVALWDVLSTEAIYGANFAFPALSQGMVGLLGISTGGYLAGKGIDHTQKS